MHRETVIEILSSSKTDTIITISIDGHVKFWKKVFSLINLLKNYKAHNGIIVGASLNFNHQLLVTIGIDKTAKIFDVLNYDLKQAVKLSFSPICC